MNSITRKLSIIAGALILVAQNAYCSSAILAHVVNFGTYGNGNVAIELDTIIDEPNCSIKYIELPSNSPIANYTLTIAAMAFATGNKIEVKTDNCLNGAPSLGNSRQSYILLKKL